MRHPGESALDVLFPPSCVGCGRVLAETGAGGAFFCEDCAHEVTELPPSRCSRCAEPGQFAGETCPRCTARPPPFSRVVAAYVHEGAVARAIHRFKYEDHPELAAPLAAMLVEETARWLPELRDRDVGRAPSSIVCALPLHPGRRAERKFDQAELLAGEVSRLTRSKRLFLLDRVRRTTRQVGLPEHEREENVSGAFRARPGSAKGMDLLLVDDVVTTGATARAASQALLDAGARSVQVLALARAYTPSR